MDTVYNVMWSNADGYSKLISPREALTAETTKKTDINWAEFADLLRPCWIQRQISDGCAVATFTPSLQLHYHLN